MDAGRVHDDQKGTTEPELAVGVDQLTSASPAGAEICLSWSTLE